MIRLSGTRVTSRFPSKIVADATTPKVCLTCQRGFHSWSARICCGGGNLSPNSLRLVFFLCRRRFADHCDLLCNAANSKTETALSDSAMTETVTTTKKLPLHVRIFIAMVIGSVIGIWANPGENPVDPQITASLQVTDTNVSLTETVDVSGDPLTVWQQEWNSAEAFAASFPELANEAKPDASTNIEVTNGRARVMHGTSGVTISWRRAHNGTPIVSTITAPSTEKLPPFWSDFAERRPYGVAERIVVLAKVIGDFFLRMLKMVTVPLILTSLITGVTGLGASGNFGKMFRRTLTYYLCTSMLAIATGLVLVNVIEPGRGAILPGGGNAIERPDQSILEIIHAQLLRLFPTNPLASIANGEFLSIISFAILLGLFINAVGGEHGKRLKELFEAFFAVMMRMTGWVISLAPIGVAAFMIYATATQGLGVFQTLAWYMATVFFALVFHAVVILPLVVRVFAKRSPLEFARHMSPALLTAFSTASSNATLPLTMNCVEKRAGVSNGTSSFVLPLGATINMDGTALYEVVAVLFIAQATPGFDLSLAQQITVAFTALIASVGAAGIPHAGLVMMAIVLQAVGLPLEAQGIIIAVDRILDMCRTSVNVWSDSCGCAVVETKTDAAQQL